jgi:hypothetical protein
MDPSAFPPLFRKAEEKQKQKEQSRGQHQGADKKTIRAMVCKAAHKTIPLSIT